MLLRIIVKAKRLIEIGQTLWGRRGWQIKMSAALSKDVSTIRRWIYANHVPPLAAMVLETMMEKR